MAIVTKRVFCLIVYAVVVSLYHAESSIATQVVQLPREGSLNDYLCGHLASSVTDGLTLELDPNKTHTISGQSCLWTNKESITIQSSGEERATVWCDGCNYTQSGLELVDVNKFTLRNIVFENCGGTAQNATIFAPIGTPQRRALESNQHAILFLSRCREVLFENVTFNNYRGYALYAVDLIGENRFQMVTITNSFAYLNRSRTSNRTDLTYSGSGLFFHFSDDLEENSSINIVNSNLSNNFNIYPDFLLNSLREVRLQNQEEDFPLHVAGGLTVHFEQKKRKVVANITGTSFENNGGSTAGGSLLVSRNTVDKSDIFFTNCTFLNNSNSIFPGGGLQLDFVYSFAELRNIPAVNSPSAKIVLENSHFQENMGGRGAALGIFTEAQNVSTITIELKSVNFVDNEATIDGDCILVESENSATYSEIRPNIKLEGITVSHSGRDSDIDTTAALSFNNVFVTINGTLENPSRISNGMNGGLKLFNTYAFLTGEVYFMNNSAVKGGAIAMEANSYLLFQEPANIVFSNNQATTGGAIYSDIVRGSQCVIQFIGLNATNVALNVTQLNHLDFNITFIDNVAEEDGHSIYAEPIFSCSWFSESVVQIAMDDVIDIFSTLYHFKSNKSSVSYKEQIRSHPYRLCFCGQNQTYPECTSDNVTGTSITVPPGRPFSISIVPADKVWNPVRSIMKVQLVENNDNILFSNNRTIYVTNLNGTWCYPLSLALHNATNSTATIQLSVQSVVGQFIKSKVNVEDCPTGFQLNEQSGICDCIPLFSNNKIKCNIETSLFTKPKNYWIGLTRYEPNVSARVEQCPPGYCKQTTDVNLSFDDQCIGGRTKELCGRCQPGMSTQFGSTDCTTCKNYWLFTIALYALAGILLVVVLFLFKLTISEGLLGSVLFYAQLFSINIGLLVATNQTRPVTVFISLLNLELGFPICFYDGMTQTVKHGLQFVFPVYLWLIVAIITILSRYSNKLAKLVGSDCAKVFVTLIYFSYTKLQRTATNSLVFSTIRTDTNNSYHVWFYDGREEYFRGAHVILVLVSIFFLMFILTPYMLFTLLSQWCLHNSWISRHFKPLIDATLAPFKDRWRFWFGLRLLIINGLILISVLVTPFNSDANTYAQLVIIMLLLVFQAHIKPYKSKLLHYLDLFFLINYVLFLIACLFVFGVVHPMVSEQDKFITGVEVIIIGSAFTVFVVTIVCHIVIRVRKYYEKNRSGRFNTESENGTEMENASEFNSFQGRNNDSNEYRPQVVTLSVVGWRDKEDDDGARLRESLLGEY